jgi:hypothetical protein
MYSVDLHVKWGDFHMKPIGSLYVLALITSVLMGYPSLAASGENSPIDDVQEKVIVGDMNFVREKDGAESVCFALSRFCSPHIFSIPGKKPRIVIDVKPVPKWYGKPSIQVGGHQIIRVRSHLHKAEEKLRIVLDLDPSKDFTVEPRYYETERVYCIYVLSR